MAWRGCQRQRQILAMAADGPKGFPRSRLQLQFQLLGIRLDQTPGSRSDPTDTPMCAMMTDDAVLLLLVLVLRSSRSRSRSST